MPGIEYHGDAPSTIVMQVIILIYVLIACVMMLNMLIAMLNNTYERIHENCDIEWKYARAELLKEYRNGQPFMFPFHVLLLPVTAMFRQSVRKEEKKQREVDCQAEEERKAERNTLFNNLCERYEKEKKTAELAIAIESGSGAGFRDRTPAEARTFSFMRR